MSGNRIDKGFRDKLGYYSTPPGENLWKSIENDLDKKDKRSAFIILFRVAAVLIPAAGILLGLKLILFNTNEIVQPQASVQTSNSPSIDPIETRATDIHEFSSTKNREQIVEKAIEEENINPTNNSGEIDAYTPTYAKKSIPNVDSQQNVKLKYKRAVFFESRYNENEVLLASISSNEDVFPSEESLALIHENLGSGAEFLLGANAGPQYSRSLNSNKENALSNSSSINNTLAYSGGMALEIKPWKRISIETGMYYSKLENTADLLAFSPIDQRSAEKEFVFVQNDTRSDDQSYGESFMLYEPSSNFTKDNTNMIDSRQSLQSANSQEFSIEESVEYVEIPLYMKYVLIDRKIGVNLIYGIGASYEIKNSIQKDAQLLIVNNSESSQSNSINFGNSLGLGFEVPFKNNFLFSVEPMIRYYFLPNTSILSNNTENYILSFMTGLKYKF